MKQIVKFVFSWIFSNELSEMKREIEALKMERESFERSVRNAESVHSHLSKQMKTVNTLLNSIDVSVDVHEWGHSDSWAVISLQGQKSDFIKFVNLGNSELEHIKQFLRQFNKVNIDASPQASKFLRIKN